MWRNLVCISLVSCFVVTGCGGPETGELDKGYMASAEELGKKRRELFEKANKNFDNLSPEDKQTYINTFEVKTEEHARKYWEMMANPPSSQFGTGVPKQ
jgi:hypothetical protein